ncbi:MAG TPA: nucleoside diphosphate kinase regulator [Burkholderiales bacterium]|nr:nucleoside diphosphate kinase regulator [Burkholderiales bacterium]
MATQNMMHFTELDVARLSVLARALASRGDGTRERAEALHDLLDHGSVLPSDEIPTDVVTMNSRVLIQDEAEREPRDITITYPEMADPAAGRVSILSPIGQAVLGRSAGQSAAFDLPYGGRGRIRVIKVLYQPEAEGDLTV